ncbi:nucleotidyl transferase AbiEii/AbiGii toxin family protein [sulfur-oxidizing endosymbiont of Gigantopelta aegis]|uniref:nucleotidyl transferase AbiEii/AbiGii toxin family protein n=1 Tax=sulfur-oxidizing endosymbiont of Gigantopelta aegis TaxID=2794934 RepID=UPI0018DE3780|nr:nucleotidyl transferase AbiEii/AbiGii toxin family protein [sulfur-oxidizing endosymbiont of Gigantopelta aegis]
MENKQLEGLTDDQKEHVSFMMEITKSVADTPMVLKGGTALLLAYGLDRFSEDLDFDSTQAINLEKRIYDAGKRSKVRIGKIFVKKNTGTTRRYIVNYEGRHRPRSLKIETSFRKSAIENESTEILNGIKVYKLNTLISQKLDAGLNRSKVRDLYDIAFLSRNYQHLFTSENIEKLAEFGSDPDSLVSRYQQDHVLDSILKDRSLDEMALQVSLNLDNLRERQTNNITRLAEKFSQDKFNNTEDQQRFVSSVNTQVESIKEEATQDQNFER